MSGMDTPRQPLVDLDRGEADLAGLGLRERKKRLRLRRIVHAAETLFMDKGFTNTTIQDIADRAEVGLGTLYLYARGKEDLLVLVFKQHILRMIDHAFECVDPDDGLLDQMMTFFDAHIEYHKQDPSLSRTVLKELSFSSTEQRRQDIEQIMQASYAKLRELIELAASRQDGNQPYPGTTAWSAFALYYHLLQGYLCGFLDEMAFRKTLRNGLSMLLGLPADSGMT